MPTGAKYCATNARTSCSTRFRTGHASSSRPLASHAAHVATVATDSAVTSIRMAVTDVRSEVSNASTVLRPRVIRPCAILGMMPHDGPQRDFPRVGMEAGVIASPVRPVFQRG